MEDSGVKEAYYRAALARSGPSELRKVSVQVLDGKVVISGRLSSFYLKQLAQEKLRPLAIGCEIVNQIIVDR